MRYLIRHTYQCKRGQGPVYLENLKVLLNILRKEGMADTKVCVDVTSSMDMVVLSPFHLSPIHSHAKHSSTAVSSLTVLGT